MSINSNKQQEIYELDQTILQTYIDIKNLEKEIKSLQKSLKGAISTKKWAEKKKNEILGVKN